MTGTQLRDILRAAFWPPRKSYLEERKVPAGVKVRSTVEDRNGASCPLEGLA
jgi:hypothetical protein